MKRRASRKLGKGIEHFFPFSGHYFYRERPRFFDVDLRFPFRSNDFQGPYDKA
jgi:hypothetical protein